MIYSKVYKSFIYGFNDFLSLANIKSYLVINNYRILKKAMKGTDLPPNKTMTFGYVLINQKNKFYFNFDIFKVI